MNGALAGATRARRFEFAFARCPQAADVFCFMKSVTAKQLVRDSERATSECTVALPPVGAEHST